MKDLNRRTRKDSDQSSGETPDFCFAYSDSDILAAEIAEWYTYSEEAEFVWNADSFKKTFSQDKYLNKKWRDLTVSEKKTYIIKILNQTENCHKKTRDDANRTILYLVQGVFKECENIEDYNANLLENVILLYECDVFNIFIDMLQYEINNITESFMYDQKYAPCISDNADLRVILSILYTIIEVIRCYEIEVTSERMNSTKEYDIKYAKMKSQLKSDLNKPLEKTNELFSVYLFQLINKFCNQNLIILPIKKILLLLWKVLLLTLGGTQDAFNFKNELRDKFNLPRITENPLLILNKMTPATPPPNPIDLVNELQFANPNSSYKRKKNGLTKQSKGIDSDDLTLTNSINSNAKLNQFGIPNNGFDSNSSNSSEYNNNENNIDTINYAESDSVLLLDSKDNNTEDAMPTCSDDNTDIENEIITLNEHANTEKDSNDHLSVISEESSTLTSSTVDLEISSDNNEVFDSNNDSTNTPFPISSESNSPPPETENGAQNDKQKLLSAVNDAANIKLKIYNQLKTLPWKPKVRLSELEAFLDQERKKFLGYGDLTNDLDTLVGLPNPIHESVRILKQHLYISLSDEQIKLEEKLGKYPMSTQKLIENKHGSDNEETPTELLFTSLINNLPQYLICLLKLLLTSVPQTKPKGESLQIMSDLFPEELNGSRFLTIKLGIDSNRHKEILIKSISGILLIMLKHFKVNHIYQLLDNRFKSHFQLDFPNCVIGQQLELDPNDLENGDSAVYRWRNVFSCINLLRILNKIAKYKRSRVMMLVIFKSAQIFKKVLRIKQAMLQYYALKLIKMQTRNMGRNWRKTNMSTMSAIYQKIRHRLNDDWAFGNELEAQAWDFQSEESVLRSKIDRYNQRKYKSNEDPTSNDFKPIDHSYFAAVNQEGIQIPEDFSDNYEKWLEEEVYSDKINWDLLLDDNNNQKVKVLF